MEKSKNKLPLGLQILFIIVKFIGFLSALIFLCLCSLVSIFFIYDPLAKYDALSLAPPIYPDSVEIISGEHSSAGNCCLAAVWVYCTDASVDELTAYFEPYVGEFMLFGSPDTGFYHAGISSENPIVKSISYFLALGWDAGYLEVLVTQDSSSCTTRSAYTYRVSYSAH